MSELPVGEILHLCGEGWVGSSGEAEEFIFTRYVLLEIISIRSRGLGLVTAAYVTFQFYLFTAVVSQATSEAIMAGRSAGK